MISGNGTEKVCNVWLAELYNICDDAPDTTIGIFSTREKAYKAVEDKYGYDDSRVSIWEIDKIYGVQ